MSGMAERKMNYGFGTPIGLIEDHQRRCFLDEIEDREDVSLTDREELFIEDMQGEFRFTEEERAFVDEMMVRYGEVMR